MVVKQHLKRYYFVSILLLSISNFVEGKTIFVSNQEDLNLLNGQLITLIQNGTRRINIEFKPGLYFYKDNCISLENITEPRLSLSINGKGALLIPWGKDYVSGDLYQGIFNATASVIDISGRRDLSYWEEVRHAESRVELVNSQKHLWRLKCSLLKDASEKECEFTYIILPCWYTSYTLKVDHIDNGYLYFVSANTSYLEGYNCYMLDADYGYAHIFPRFKICNYSEVAGFAILDEKRVCLSNNVSKAHVCDAGTFVRINDCQIRNIKICDLTFLGSTAISKKTYLLNIKNCSANKVQILNNSFEGMQNTVIGIENTNNIEIEKNTITNCYRSGVFVDNLCSNIDIKSNTISYCGLSMKQDLGICVFGGNYHISNNTIFDYGYAAINVGMWHGHEKICPSYGIIENNEIYQTPLYIQTIDNYGLMDAGAIYLSTQNEGAIIRNNYIHDISGIKDNRGIFCDDGARYFTIEGNIITNIFNCYCIDSWRVSSHEDKIGPTNVGNTIRNNIVDGIIRFEAREGEDNSCELGTNFFLVSSDRKRQENFYKNLNTDNVEKLLFCMKKEGHYFAIRNINDINEQNLKKRLKKILTCKR